MLVDRNRLSQGQPRVAGWVIADPGGELAERAPDLRAHLAKLVEERLCAREVGLDGDRAYMGDLDLELAAVRAAFVGAAVLQLVALRAEFNGRGRG